MGRERAGPEQKVPHQASLTHTVKADARGSRTSTEYGNRLAFSKSTIFLKKSNIGEIAITGNADFSDASVLGDDIYIAAGSVCISKNSTIGDIFGPYTIC